MDQAGGYDYVFVEALSEDFTCVFCHLALKNPLQVEDCGHIFCKGCFDQMKQNAEIKVMKAYVRKTETK